jgi:hypothetical protein
MPRKQKQLKPPSPDVAEIDAGFTHGEFDRALKKVTRQQLDDPSGRDPKSLRTSA